jgi:hypothetical protein
MYDSAFVDKLAQGVRRIGTSGLPDIEAAVECYVDSELAILNPGERLVVLEKLVDQFGEIDSGVTGIEDAAAEDIMRIVSLFLGNSVSKSGLSSKEISGIFAESLNTIFNMLNQIISVINVTLLGQQQELETIRKIIRSNIEEGRDHTSLKDYLDQIQKAFLTAHQSFQQAATTLVGEVLAELDPEVLLLSKSSGLKFGPLRKAELFETYVEKYGKCKRWFDSGQLKERLLREFEKNCQQTYK